MQIGSLRVEQIGPETLFGRIRTGKVLFLGKIIFSHIFFVVAPTLPLPQSSHTHRVWMRISHLPHRLSKHTPATTGPWTF